MRLAEQLGLDGLADMEAELVRHRPVPPRLVRAIVEAEERPLSPKEREVMVLLASGFSRQEIADEQGVTIETIKHQLKTAYAKLGVDPWSRGNKQIRAINAFIEWES